MNKKLILSLFCCVSTFVFASEPYLVTPTRVNNKADHPVEFLAEFQVEPFVDAESGKDFTETIFARHGVVPVGGNVVTGVPSNVAVGNNENPKWFLRLLRVNSVNGQQKQFVIYEHDHEKLRN